MEKISIVLNDYHHVDEALDDLCQKFSFQRNQIHSVEDFEKKLLDINEDRIVEIRQNDTLSDDILVFQKVFEFVQLHNDHIYVVRGIG
ncbi:hypothetical protein [uncultured Faecalicoccus sp.]|uniref:hypothetical protein n=1 Tax=uncultured Faecalicoccus sp. TaxID=1971760 RepID=UPI0026271257|nr:hypothetical protein [uncultured Faecalicoccus sp.]